MSAFTDALRSAAQGDAGMTTGEPKEPVRTRWAQVHAAACAGARVLAGKGVRPGDAVAVLAAKPFEVAPVAQAAWLAGASVTMLHQPTARTNLATFAADTAAVLSLIGARAIVLGEPFTEFVELLDDSVVAAFTVADLVAEPGGPAPEIEIDEDSPALLQLTSGSTSTPKAVLITHRKLWSNVRAMCASASIIPGEVMVSWLPLFHDMGMVGFLTLPMCQGVELVTVTPADFLSSPLLWPTLISKYSGTITAAPNFAYALTARVLARPSSRDLDLDLSSMRFALNGAEPIDVDAVRAFLDAGARFGLPSTAVVCAYGMAEATLAVSFHPWGTPLRVDTVLAAELEQRHRAVPVDPATLDPTGRGAGSDDTSGPGPGTDSAGPGTDIRTFPVLGPPLQGIEVAAFDEEGRQLAEREVGVLHLRGRLDHRRIPDRGRAEADEGPRTAGWTRGSGLSRRRRGGDLRPGQGRDHHGRPEHLSHRRRTGRRGRRRRPRRERGRGALDDLGRQGVLRAGGGVTAGRRRGRGETDRRRRPLRGDGGHRRKTGRGAGVTGRQPAEDSVRES